MHNPPHPGELIKAEILAHLELSIFEASERFGVSCTDLFKVIYLKSSIDITMASSLEKSGYGSARSWMKMQDRYDLFITAPCVSYWGRLR